MAVVGPLENMDLVGLDLVRSIHQYLLRDLADDHQPLPALNQCVEQGHLGIKSGEGFYDWHLRDPAQLRDRRDRQIVHQLEFLKELGAI
jgi:3-hydroxybutyryl-CoA dehydrogenase